MRGLFTVLVVALLLASNAAAGTGPVPSTMRSSSLSVEQEQELNRRLELLQSRLNALASQTELRVSAVRNIAVEIFGARPDLDFETYAALIVSGARELRTYITGARGRTDTDPTLAELRARAIAVAEDGRLAEARILYDELIAANRTSRQSQRDAEDVADAADIAESARLAFVVADFPDAARRYALAADAVPRGSIALIWLYRRGQADAIYRQGDRFGQMADLQMAAHLYREVVLPMAPREMRPADWATTKARLGNVLRLLGERGDAAALAESITVFEQAIEVSPPIQTREEWVVILNDYGSALGESAGRVDEPGARRAASVFERALSLSDPADVHGWATSQLNYGTVLSHLGDMGDENASSRAQAAYSAVLSATTADSAPYTWALAQMNLGILLSSPWGRRTESGPERTIGAFESALSVFTRESYPREWERVQYNLGTFYYENGQFDDVEALRKAVDAFDMAGQTLTRERNLGLWESTQFNLAGALSLLGEHLRDVSTIRRATHIYESLLAVADGADSERWASTQRAMGRAFRRLGELDDQSAWGPAAAAFEAALSVPDSDRVRRAEIQLELSRALLHVHGGGDQGALSRAIAAAEAALGGVTREGAPETWGDAQFRLAAALHVLGESGDNESLLRAASGTIGNFV